MFTKSGILFLYADAPLHAGAGVSLGAVDLVIQRERATQYPTLQGSGLKGALRDHFGAGAGAEESPAVKTVFGSGAGEGDHAGAAAFGDGRIVLFPVRSLAGTFAYCTSRYALARLYRDLRTAGAPDPGLCVPDEPASGAALGAPNSPLAVGDKVVLEELDLKFKGDPGLQETGAWLAANALPQDGAFGFFRKRLETHLLLIPEDDFTHFVRFATQVEPHVKIDDKTGTAQGEAFFYAENLPPDSLLYSVVGIGPPRRRDDAGGLSNADDVVGFLRDGLDGQAFQVGADATTGRGVVHARLCLAADGKEV